jgi:hypothetical protein
LNFVVAKSCAQNCKETVIARRRIPQYHQIQCFPTQLTSIF